jgi:hypothetical protein
VVDATPQRIGQSYLRALYDDLHYLEEGDPPHGAAKYYTQAFLSEDSKRSLHWWMHHLTHTVGSATYRATSGRGIVLKWGDGSGTGMGGTTEFYQITEDQLHSLGMIKLWMGVWGARAKPRTSAKLEGGPHSPGISTPGKGYWLPPRPNGVLHDG